VGWGHATPEYAVDVCLAAGVKRLALFHHDPTHDDTQMVAIEAAARTRVADAGGAMEVFAAREGMTLDVTGVHRVERVTDVSALRRRLIAGSRVLVVMPDETHVATIEETLAEDGILALPVPDMRAAVTRGSEHMPDLAVIDADLPAAVGLDLLPAFRTRMGREHFPVILLAADPEARLNRADDWATDYLPKPYSPPMLRARVRSWLARTLIDGGAAGHGATAEAMADPREERVASHAVLASMLASVPLFSKCTDEQLGTLVSHATEQVYPSGYILTRQGEPPDNLWVLFSGRVRVVEATADGQSEMLLGELGKAEVFGEVGILRDQPRSATIIAVDRTHCLVLRRRDFLKVLGESPDLATGLLRVLASRLYEADRRLARYAPDPLTGLASRRSFHEHYRRLAAGARRRKTGLLLLAIDVVNLKGVNDAFGYGLGDEVLRTVADALLEATRSSDIIARYGGDEFAALLLDAQPKDTELIIARVNDKLTALAAQRRLPVPIECSTGIAWSLAPPESADEFLREADQDMQRKRQPT
jgi:diguanylate cyclase (GGDEF)-like protein